MDTQTLIDGVPLRDYFAAHAPEPPPDWGADMKTPRPAPTYSCGCVGDQVASCAHPHRETYPTNRQELDRWDVVWQAQRKIQWAWRYADAMLEARELSLANWRK